MYISWVHHYVPKIFGILSFLINPFFIYLVFTVKRSYLGNYRYLLTYFATFNLFYSSIDVAVPIGIHGYRYCFFFFVPDGMFSFASNFNHYILLIRCSMVACSYAIMATHFIYRYMIINGNKLIKTHFIEFMTASLLLTVLYFVVWGLMVHTFMWVTPEMRDYVQESFQEEYGANSQNINTIGTIYSEVEESNVIRSWTGVGLLTTVPLFTIIFYIHIGFKIRKKLQSSCHQMSDMTKKMQKKLFRALAVQTTIPIVVSFLPCMICLLAPAVNIEMGRTMNYTGVIALALFPFFDPLAIIFCLPVLLRRLLPKRKPKQGVTTTGIELPSI